MVKCLPEFEYFTVFLKNRNFISKIRRSKVTDYAALNELSHRGETCASHFPFLKLFTIAAMVIYVCTLPWIPACF